MSGTTTVLSLVTIVGSDTVDLVTHMSTGISQKVEDLLTGAAYPAGNLLIDFNSASNRSLKLQNGGAGIASLAFDSGATIDWNSGDVTITHSVNTLAFVGASTGYTFDGPTTVTVASAAGIIARSGAAGSYPQIDLGRTAQEATLSVVHSAGAFFAGSAVGDLAIRTEAAKAVIIGVNVGTLGLKIDSAGDIQWGKALVALGGGGAATLGTCGGSGPLTTTQNTWMRVLDSTGAAFWVPAWK